MSNESKEIKLMGMVKAVDEELSKNDRRYKNELLLLIYDYEKMNEYGKIIVDN